MNPNRRALEAAALALCAALTAACGTMGGAGEAAGTGGEGPPPRPAVPPTAAAQADRGPVPVYGANLNGPGPQIYKELRQEDSLMAFLACQGEPDRVEVVTDPDGATRIVLEYDRRGLRQTGVVEIEPGAAGFLAARPIDPNGKLPSAAAKAGRKPERASAPAPPPPARKPSPPPRDAAPERELMEDAAEAGGAEGEVEEPEEIAEPASTAAQPTARQLDDCPIEPWREDCRALCAEGASWDWCDYAD